MKRRDFLQLSAAITAAMAVPPNVFAKDATPFRIGIVGSDNSHAEVFASLLNLDEGLNGLGIAGARVTHIWGDDPAITQDRATKAKIPNISEKPADMLGQVDGVLCVRRHGARHLEDARPFLEAGVPVFVDKPLSVSLEDAEALVALAENAKVGFTSFSTLRYAQSTQAFLKALRENAGEMRAGVVTGPCDLDSEYGGVFFYGIHVVELMLETFGYGCQNVQATQNGGNAVVVCRYPDSLTVTLNLLANAKSVFHISAFGAKGWRDHEVDNATNYYDGMNIIFTTLKTGKWPLSREELLTPVKILSAIRESLSNGGNVVKI